jgi:hypothetical protein
MHCLFTGEETNSDEHVIPAGLQRRFGLANQQLILPNGTELRYSHARVPASQKHNAAFGKIENRIAEGQASQMEVYLWALKIHIGLIFRDSTLRADVKKPKGPFILDIGEYESEVEFFRQVYSSWLTGKAFTPSPLGSVFVLDSLVGPKTFDFFHCMLTGTVGINLGDKFVIAFLWDQRDGLNYGKLLTPWFNEFLPNANKHRGTAEFEAQAAMAHRIWACEAAYWLVRRQRSLRSAIGRERFVLLPTMSARQAHPPDEVEYRQVCRSFGLDLVEFNGTSNNRYRHLDIVTLKAQLARPDDVV